MNFRRQWIGFLVIGLLLVATWWGSRWYTAPVPPEISMDGAEPYMIDAIQAAREVVRREPRSGTAWGRLAMVLSANGFEKEALQCYPFAQRFEPENPAWPYLHGFQLVNEHPQEGLQLARKALELAKDPSDRAVILFRLALTLVEYGELDEAGRHLQELAGIDPDGPRVNVGLGLLALARQDRIAARDRFKVVAESPFYRKSASRHLAGLVDDAELARKYQDLVRKLPDDTPWPDRFEEAVALRKLDRMSRIAQFRALEAQGRKREAIEFLREFVAVSPDNEVCYLLGFALYSASEFDEAETMFRLALRYDAKFVKSHMMLGACLLERAKKSHEKQGGKTEALELFRQAVAAEDQVIALHGEYSVAYVVRGQALKYLDRIDEAVEDLRKALLLQTEVADTHLLLGETLAEAGQWREALEHLENAVRLARPNDERPRLALEKWRAKAKEPTKK